MPKTLTSPPWMVAALLFLASTAASAQIVEPADVAGLEAWYELESVHRRSRDGDTVDRWTDSSGNGHDLILAAKGTPPVFNTRRLGDKPMITIGRATRFDVTEPFELNDHTIFLVYATDQPLRAFFSSDLDTKLGIVLRGDGQYHYLQNSSRGSSHYNRTVSPTSAFNITTLGRDSGSLMSFVNGDDRSTGIPVAVPLRVGRLFRIDHTLHVSRDGEGLQIAEMIFYDRYLRDDEREGVTRYLAEKYGIEVAFTSTTRAAAEAEAAKLIEIDDKAVQVRASTRTNDNLNEEVVAIGWDFPGQVDGPFHFDSESGNTRLYCKSDGTRVRVTVKLPLRTKVADASIRLLIKTNDEVWHPEEALSEPFAGQGEDKASEARLQVELNLDNGDFIEVITSRDAAPGVVRLATAQALFIVERFE